MIGTPGRVIGLLRKLMFVDRSLGSVWVRADEVRPFGRRDGGPECVEPFPASQML